LQGWDSCMIWVLLCSLAFANDAITLEKGDKAPFTGTLLSPEAAAKIITGSEGSLQKCIIESKKDLALQEAQLTFERKNIEASLAACTLRQQEIEKLYDQQILFLEKQIIRPKWEGPVYFIAGVLTSAGLIYGSSVILQNIGGIQ
jgi:hypothetical protein